MRRETSRFIRSGLESRTIFLPRGFLDKFDTRPGQLTDVLREMEARLITAIGESLGVVLKHHSEVKHADRAALRLEAELMMPEPIDGWFDLPVPIQRKLVPWRSDVAAEMFLTTFRKLSEESNVCEPATVLV